MCCRDEADTSLMVATGHFLFQGRVKKHRFQDEKDYAYLEIMEGPQALDALDRICKSARVLWSRDYEGDHTV